MPSTCSGPVTAWPRWTTNSSALQASHGARGLLGAGFGLHPEDPQFGRDAGRIPPALRREHLPPFTALPRHAGIARTSWNSAASPGAWSPTSPRASPSRCCPCSTWPSGQPASSAATPARSPSPIPAPMLAAAECAGHQPEQCLYLGDAARDIEAAAAAAMPALVAAWGYLGDAADTAARPGAPSACWITCDIGRPARLDPSDLHLGRHCEASRAIHGIPAYLQQLPAISTTTTSSRPR